MPADNMNKKSLDDDIQKINNAKDMEKNTQISRFLLTHLGLWPFDQSRDSKFFNYMKIFYHVFLYSFALIPAFLHLVYEEKDLRVRFEILL